MFLSFHKLKAIMTYFFRNFGFKLIQNQFEKQMNSLPNYFITKPSFRETNSPLVVLGKKNLKFCQYTFNISLLALLWKPFEQT